MSHYAVHLWALFSIQEIEIWCVSPLSHYNVSISVPIIKGKMSPNSVPPSSRIVTIMSCYGKVMAITQISVSTPYCGLHPIQ